MLASRLLPKPQHCRRLIRPASTYRDLFAAQARSIASAPACSASSRPRPDRRCLRSRSRNEVDASPPAQIELAHPDVVPWVGTVGDGDADAGALIEPFL